MEQQEETKTGIIIFLQVNDGTKSEVYLPFLYTSKKVAPIELFFEGDNPFENNIAEKYDGKFVSLSGIQSSSNVFLVKEIKE